MQKYIAEGAGTFLLVFIGTLSVALGGGSILLVSLTFGVMLFLIVLLIGPLSGAHVNPAVSLGALMKGDLSSHDIVPYWIAQCIGAIAGSVSLSLIVGSGHSLGEVLLPPNTPLTLHQAFLVEIALSFFFVSIVLLTKGMSERKQAGILGLTLFLLHLLALPLTGAGLNPARALAPVIVGADPVAASVLWISVAGSFLGGAAAGIIGRFLPKGEQCAK